MNIRNASCCVFAAAVALLVWAAAPVLAADVTWDGSASTDWNNPDNWDTGVPGNADRAIFPAALTPNQPNLNVNDQVQSLRFEKTDGGWTLGGSGQTLTIDPESVLDIIIEDLATSGTNTIDADINPTGFGPYNINLNGGMLWSNGTITPNANQVLTINGGTACFARIGKTNNGRLELAGNGTLELRGAQDGSLDPNQNVEQAGSLTLILGHKDAMGAGQYSPQNNSVLKASIDLTGANALVNDVLITPLLAGNATHFAGSHDITFTGGLALGSGRDVRIESNMDPGKKVTFTGDVDSTDKRYYVTGDGDIEFSGDLTGDSNRDRNDITRDTGDGTLILSGANNTYDGVTQVNDGTLRITGRVLNTEDLIINGDGVLDLASGGLIRVLQSNFAETEATAAIAAGAIVGNRPTVSTFNDGATDFTQIETAPEGAAETVIVIQ
ncbi:MAG: autotransporter-associated beta strand repeat-containing protein [Phycisphaerae bacterium]|nr:autotransporter-associated beta strand repeat-containing protein [Phycisphaerae bacterium]